MRDSTFAENQLAKTPTEEVLFHFDFTKRLLVGETISTALVTATPTGLTIGLPSINGAKVQISILSGTKNEAYLLNCQVTTSIGQKREVQGYLYVE